MGQRVDLKLLQKRAFSLRAEGKYEEAIEVSFDLLENGKQFNDSKSILSAHMHSAASYYCLGDLEDAFYHIDAHNEYCVLYGTDSDWIDSYNMQFLLYEFKKDYGNMKDVLLKSIRLGKKLRKHFTVANSYSYLSLLYNEQGNYTEALEAANSGFQFAEFVEYPIPILQFRLTINTAWAHIGLQQLDQAQALILAMKGDSALNDHLREKSQLFMLEAKRHEASGQIRQAFDCYTEAKKIVDSYYDAGLLKDIQKERLRLSELLGDVEEICVIQKEYIQLLHDMEEQELAKQAQLIDLKIQLSSIEQRANIDFLTGIYNRRYVETTTNQWLTDAKDQPEDIVCIAFDVDNLKDINDRHGHLLGDEVIKLVAQACSRIVRKEDLLGRFGGDEFVLIMKDITSENAYRKATKIADVVRNLQLTHDDKRISVTVSIGIADNMKRNIQSFQELFHLADQALYQAKRDGKDQIHTFA